MTYTPELVDYYLRWWRELEAAAESPRTAAHLFDWHCRLSDRGCAVALRRSQRSRHYVVDQLSYARIHADVASAASQLSPGSLEQQIVSGRMAGMSLGHVARVTRTRRQTVAEGYQRALTYLVASLEPHPPTSQQPAIEASVLLA